MNQRGNYKHQTYTKETHIPIDYKLHLMSATCDGEDQGRICNKLIDFGLHKLDPQSFFLTPSVWVLGFFFLFSFFSVVDCESLAGSHKFKQILYIVMWGWVLQLNKKRKKKKKRYLSEHR